MPIAKQKELGILPYNIRTLFDKKSQELTVGKTILFAEHTNYPCFCQRNLRNIKNYFLRRQ